MKSIVQIELCNVCNRRCRYCGQTNMKRERGFMTMETVNRCSEILNILKQDTVGLHHYGESLMHPQFIEIVELLNSKNIIPWLNTNGDFLSDSIIKKLSKLKFKSIVISGHMEREKRILLYQKCSEAGITSFWQIDVEGGASNLANQIVLENATDNNSKPLQNPIAQCKFLREQMCCVLYTGDLVPCCFDYDGIGIFGNIVDAAALELYPKVNQLCLQCPGHPSN